MPPETAAQTPAADANSQPAPAAPASPDTLLTAPPAATPPATDQAAAPAAADAAGSPDKSAETPPADYELKAPEGVTFNAEAMTELKAFAKEKNLTQEEAQKLADLGAKTVQKVEAGYREKVEQAQAQWAEASRTDKEFGGDNLTENVGVAKKALDTFGSPELSQMLKESGLGNHPEIIRAFYRVGKAISEDRLVSGTTRPSETDTAKKLYPTMN